MMKRKLFFWIDKLQIQRGERIAVSLLMGLLLIVSMIGYFAGINPSAEEYNYDELEQVFRERSKQKVSEEETIMARYTAFGEDEMKTENTEPNKSRPVVKSGEIEDNRQETPDSIRININKADAEELQKLPGIGPAYSERIVAWRNRNGKFKEVEQLLEIRGIGPVRLEKIRPLIEVGDDL